MCIMYALSSVLTLPFSLYIVYSLCQHHFFTLKQVNVHDNSINNGNNSSDMSFASNASSGTRHMRGIDRNANDLALSHTEGKSRLDYSADSAVLRFEDRVERETIAIARKANYTNISRFGISNIDYNDNNNNGNNDNNNNNKDNNDDNNNDKDNNDNSNSGLNSNVRSETVDNRVEGKIHHTFSYRLLTSIDTIILAV
jgi:hypothetical protein